MTGWSRDNPRRRLVAAPVRQPRTPKFSYDARKVLQKVWAASGGQCGKYLAVSMRVHPDALERHGELVVGVDRYSAGVRAELLKISAASIDRYLSPAKAKDAIGGGSTTKPSPLLRSSITIRRARDDVTVAGSVNGTQSQGLQAISEEGTALLGLEGLALVDVELLEDGSGDACRHTGRGGRGLPDVWSGLGAAEGVGCYSPAGRALRAGGDPVGAAQEPVAVYRIALCAWTVHRARAPGAVPLPVDHSAVRASRCRCRR